MVFKVWIVQEKETGKIVFEDKHFYSKGGASSALTYKLKYDYYGKYKKYQGMNSKKWSKYFDVICIFEKKIYEIPN